MPVFYETHTPAKTAHGVWIRLLALRRERIAPFIPGAQSLGAGVLAQKAVATRWRLGDDSVLTLAINLGDEAVEWAEASGPLLFESCDGAYERLKEGRLAANACVAMLDG